MSDLFSSSWATALEHELTASETYRRAAAGWKGALLFHLEPDPALGFAAERLIFLDLIHGSARAVRPALPQDRSAATFTLAGPAAVWLDLLAGRLEAGAALMGGKLRLTRGSFFSLLPHLGAARALLDCAQRVGPGDPTGSA